MYIMLMSCSSSIEDHMGIGCGTPVAEKRCASFHGACSCLVMQDPLQALLQCCSILGGKILAQVSHSRLICLTTQSSLQALLERCSNSDDAIRWARCLSEILKHAGHMCSASVTSAYIEVVKRLQVSVCLNSQQFQCVFLWAAVCAVQHLC